MANSGDFGCYSSSDKFPSLQFDTGATSLPYGAFGGLGLTIHFTDDVCLRLFRDKFEYKQVSSGDARYWYCYLRFPCAFLFDDSRINLSTGSVEWNGIQLHRANFVGVGLTELEASKDLLRTTRRLMLSHINYAEHPLNSYLPYEDDTGLLSYEQDGNVDFDADSEEPTVEVSDSVSNSTQSTIEERVANLEASLSEIKLLLTKLKLTSLILAISKDSQEIDVIVVSDTLQQHWVLLVLTTTS